MSGRRDSVSVVYIRLPAWLFVVPLALRSRDDVWVGAPNGLAFSCRERAAQDDAKKATISRAKRSAATPGWAARLAWLQPWLEHKL